MNSAQYGLLNVWSVVVFRVPGGGWEGVLHAVHARCMYWGAFVWLTTCS